MPRLRKRARQLAAQGGQGRQQRFAQAHPRAGRRAGLGAAAGGPSEAPAAPVAPSRSPQTRRQNRRQGMREARQSGRLNERQRNRREYIRGTRGDEAAMNFRQRTMGQPETRMQTGRSRDDYAPQAPQGGMGPMYDVGSPMGGMGPGMGQMAGEVFGQAGMGQPNMQQRYPGAAQGFGGPFYGGGQGIGRPLRPGMPSQGPMQGHPGWNQQGGGMTTQVQRNPSDVWGPGAQYAGGRQPYGQPNMQKRYNPYGGY